MNKDVKRAIHHHIFHAAMMPLGLCKFGLLKQQAVKWRLQQVTTNCRMGVIWQRQIGLHPRPSVPTFLLYSDRSESVPIALLNCT